MNDEGQVHVIEAIIVGVLIFVALAMTSVFRVPTAPGTSQQSELERVGGDALLALSVKPPGRSANCNEAGRPCPFSNELERMLSLALRYQGVLPVYAGEPRNVDPLADYLNQSLPDGSRYLIYYSNGINVTKMTPLNLVAPQLDVVVAHQYVTPNWTIQAANLSASVLIQIGEITGFTDATTDKIYDPLGRSTEEWLRTHKSVLSNATGSARVPSSAIYGTYALCNAGGACRPFTLVPPGVYGAGSSILASDRDNSTNVVPLGDFYSYARYNDSSLNDQVTSGERIYLDLNTSGPDIVNPGDLRLSPKTSCVGSATCHAGSYVQTGESDVNDGLENFPVVGRPRVTALRGDNDGVLEEAEHLYLDVNDDGVVNAGDRRLSRVATFRSGTEVAGSEIDDGRNLLPILNYFTNQVLHYADADLDGGWDAGELMYLDLVGNGQTSGLETYDIRLSPKGSATTRYVYDVKVVTWFGI